MARILEKIIVIVPIFLMKYTQLSNHSPNNFWCSGLDHQKWYMVVYGFICLIKWD